MLRNLFLFVFFLPLLVTAQDNYEIQVYASPTMDKGTTIFELHSNYTFVGEKDLKGTVRPSYHSLHETVEITHGITDNFELGFYIFTNATHPYGWQYVGSHIRPRISAPTRWKLPVGLSLSAEIGFQRKEYSSETWSVELRPIIDKQWDQLYISLNPVLGFQLKGEQPASAPSFAPNCKAAWSLSKKISLGAEYYGDLGPVNHFDPASEQSQALFAVVDLYLHPDWEFNFGTGWGLTPGTDGFNAKLILGRHINWKKRKPSGK
ncbi:MAG: hypothetical protein U0X40_00850 [Ferruginibacter sp.]